MGAPVLFVEAADPARPHVIGTKAAQYAMYCVDQLRRMMAIFLLSRPIEQFEEVADGKRIGPQIARLIFRRRRQTSPRCELHHQLCCYTRCVVSDHFDKYTSRPRAKQMDTGGRAALLRFLLQQDLPGFNLEEFPRIADHRHRRCCARAAQAAAVPPSSPMKSRRRISAPRDETGLS